MSERVRILGTRQPHVDSSDRVRRLWISFVGGEREEIRQVHPRLEALLRKTHWIWSGLVHSGDAEPTLVLSGGVLTEGNGIANPQAARRHQLT